MRTSAILTLLALLLPTGLASQEVREPSHWSALRVSKWAALTATLATAVYGVATVRDADRGYERLELACQEAPQLCELRLPDGSYSDRGLERQYQQVLRQDRRARTALLGSQLGVAATVVLFVLDMRHARPPADVPYHPRGLQVRPRRDGAELRVTVSAL